MEEKEFRNGFKNNRLLRTGLNWEKKCNVVAIQITGSMNPSRSNNEEAWDSMSAVVCCSPGLAETMME